MLGPGAREGAGRRVGCAGALNSKRGAIDLGAATGGGATDGAGTLASVAGDVPDTDSGGGPAAAVGGLLDAALAPVVLLPVAGEPAAEPVPSLLGALLVAPPVAPEPAGVAVLALSGVEGVEDFPPPDPVTLLEVVVALPLALALAPGSPPSWWRPASRGPAEPAAAEPAEPARRAGRRPGL